MSDFLERFGEQLRAAQAPQTSRRNVAPYGHLLRRRGLMALVAVVVVAAPALAITEPWNPTIGRPNIDGPVTSDRSPVAAAATDVLAVLRRPQTAADRDGAAPLLKGIVGSQIDRVQTASIRLLADGWALVPATAVQAAPGRSVGEQICFTNGRSTTCGSARGLSSTGIAGSEATATATTFTGLVPDGVARVRFVGRDGSTKEVAVASNFYELVVDEIAPPRMIDAPKGYDGPARIPGPPLPVAGVTEWLDANGTVVGPTP